MLSAPSELTDHLARISALERGEVERLLNEILEFFDEDAEGFVRRRHKELRARGWNNERIWDRLEEETRDRPFRVPGLTRRKLRRIVYG